MELKWWASDEAGSGGIQPEEEDMQQVKRNEPVHPMGFAGVQEDYAAVGTSIGGQDIQMK